MEKDNNIIEILKSAGIILIIVLTSVLISSFFTRYFLFKDQMTTFVKSGPRFTAQDGQILCERVRLVEEEINEIHGHNNKVEPCLYYPKNETNDK